jgi:ribosome-binding factor A
MGRTAAKKGPSQRQLRVGEELRHALAWVLERGDIREATLTEVPVTVTEVRLSPDLRNATIFVMPLGGKRMDEVLEAMRKVKGHLRHEMLKKVEMRVAPNLFFEADTSFDEANHIEQLLHSPEVLRDLAPKLEEIEDIEDPGDGA